MAIVTFWSDGKRETGKTSAIAALSTYMGIEHNYRILVISTNYNDVTLKYCFWEEERLKKNLGLFGPNTNVAMQNGIEGLNRFIKSNKVTPDIITNYTKIVFKNRLEILSGFTGERKDYAEIEKSYPSVIELANQYYDLVLVDLGRDIDEDVQKAILHRSDLIVATVSQRLASINEFIRTREENQLLNSPKTLILVGRYDKFSKYTSKNITRYLKEKNEVSTLPYNTLYFEAFEEAGVPDLFLKIRKIKDETDRNGFFVKEVKRLSDNIIYRLQVLQMKIK